MTAAPLAACQPQSVDVAERARAAGIVPWPDFVKVPEVTHPGYGTYPDYDAIGEVGPWPKILPATLRKGLEKFSDIILPATETAPAPSAVGIGEFWDDWVSAPYPYMTETRGLVWRGFTWLNLQMKREHGADWLGGSKAQAADLVARLRDAAADPDAPDYMEAPATLYTHLRKLVIGAYYTTPEGEADLGHIHARPISGDYPGPTGEALEHVLGVISGLGLKTDDLPIGAPPYAVAPYRFVGDEPA